MKVLLREAEKSGGVRIFEKTNRRKYIKRREDGYK